MDALTQIVLKKEFNKKEFNQKFIRKFKNNTLPFNLFLIYLFTVASILLVRFNKIKLIIAIAAILLIIGLLILIDFLTYKIDLKREVKTIENYAQTVFIYKDRIELKKDDEIEPRVFMYNEASIANNVKKEEIIIQYKNGAFVIPKNMVESFVYEHLMALVEKEI